MNTNTISAERQSLPATIEAEKAVLGAILLRPSFLGVCLDFRLQPEDFSLDSHQQLYAAFVRIHDDGGPVDLVTLIDELDVDTVGGMAYIEDLADPGIILLESHIRHHCEIV